MDKATDFGISLANRLIDLTIDGMGTATAVIKREMAAHQWGSWPSGIRRESVEWLPAATQYALGTMVNGHDLWLQDCVLPNVSFRSKRRMAVAAAKECGPAARHIIWMTVLATACSPSAGMWSIEWFEANLKAAGESLQDIVGKEFGLDHMVVCRNEYDIWTANLVASVYRCAAHEMEVGDVSRYRRLLESDSKAKYKQELRDFIDVVKGSLSSCQISAANPYLWRIARQANHMHGAQAMSLHRVMCSTRSRWTLNLCRANQLATIQRSILRTPINTQSLLELTGSA
jgi:hypothetical protein